MDRCYPTASGARFGYVIVERQEAHNVMKHLQTPEGPGVLEGLEQEEGTTGFTGITYVSLWNVERRDDLWAFLKETLRKMRLRNCQILFHRMQNVDNSADCSLGRSFL